jgi:hypothetical protein
MKSILLFLLSVPLCLCGLTTQAQTTQPRTLSWTYTNTTPPDAFVLSCTTNLATPLTNWTVLAVVPCPITATNVSTNQGLLLTNYTQTLVTNVTVQLPPAQWFFTCQASNQWGLSFFCPNLAATEPPPSNPATLSIR